MTTINNPRGHHDNDTAWERFVIDYGHGVQNHDIAHVLGVDQTSITKIRRTNACTQGKAAKQFAELFVLWHGREPADTEWPTPRLVRQGQYQWQLPELALLASLVGRLGVPDIAATLTERLRTTTGDPLAARTAVSTQIAIHRIGLQTRDVIGGISITDASHEVGSLSIIEKAINSGELPLIRIGHRRIIPYAAWDAYKALRVPPPPGHVRLATLKEALSIRSDKLSEFARLGYIPSAVRCITRGYEGSSTQYGIWWIESDVADRLLADRRAKRPMPWHGKALSENLRNSYALWIKRRHPATCEKCQEIWGPQGSPVAFEDYATRYVPMRLGSKRHLTAVWTHGITIAAVAHQAGCRPEHVRRAIDNARLKAVLHDGVPYVSKSAATIWIDAGQPTSERTDVWISLATAIKQYLFTETTLNDLITAQEFAFKTGTLGGSKGKAYVLWQQCAAQRDRTGYTPCEVARKMNLDLGALQHALLGYEPHHTGTVSSSTLTALVHLTRTRKRKRDVAADLAPKPSYTATVTDDSTTPATGHDWLRLGKAAAEAGVSIGTIVTWGQRGEVIRTHCPTGWHYSRTALRERARKYWKAPRALRAIPPPWLQAEYGAPNTQTDHTP